jgi:hypothetical protein
MKVRSALVLAGVAVLALTGCDGQVPDAGGAISELEGAAGQIGSEIGGAIDDIGQQADDGEGQEADQADEDVPAAAPTETPAAPTADDDGTPAWLLPLLAVLVLLLIVALVAALRRRRQAAEARRRLRDEALLETDWLIDAASEQPSSVDAAPRARDVRVHADRLADALRRLAPRSDQRTSEAIRALHDAAADLARTTIARLDDVAAGRPPRDDLVVEDLIQRTINARRLFED